MNREAELALIEAHIRERGVIRLTPEEVARHNDAENLRVFREMSKRRRNANVRKTRSPDNHMPKMSLE